jgi:hypothetical protein
MDEIEPVELLHQRLAEALQRSRSQPFTAPVTVAEIYQELVPYRSLRGEPGFSMNADYEHVLLRFLGGEGERAQLEPATAQEVILQELRSPNPNVTLYRQYAGCDVWVRPPAGTERSHTPDVSDAGTTQPQPQPHEDAGNPPLPRDAAPVRPQKEPEPVRPAGGAGCVFCDGRLPAGRPVRYCPFCGGDQTMRPCGSCGEALEPGWTFCVACGSTTGRA